MTSYDDGGAGFPAVGEPYRAELVDGPCNGTQVRMMAIGSGPAEHLGRPLNQGQTAWYTLTGGHSAHAGPVWTYRFDYVESDAHGLA
jgi:hypothetical protein